MFGSFFDTIRTNSSKISESLSSENLRYTTTKLSSALDNVKATIKNKTTNLSGHLTKTYPKGFFSKSNNFKNNNSFDSSYNYPPNEFIDGRLEIRPDESYDEDSSEEECDNSLVSRFSRATRLSKKSRLRRNEREEIRRRLASGDLEDLPPTDRPGKKPSLQSRLQSGMNLQICFMNDAMSDSESPSSDSSPHSLPPTPKSKTTPHPRSLPPYPQMGVDRGKTELSEASRLQAEARQALSQAQGLARMQMHQERRRLQTSPITDMLRNSLRKVGVELAEGRRRLSRQLLTDMNVAQLQVIVNDLHTQIESLNEGLVKYLMERDELHMGQDSMLVDIEDLTRYLGAKENLLKEEMAQNNINQNNNNHVPSSKPVITRIVSLGKK